MKHAKFLCLLLLMVAVSGCLTPHEWFEGGISNSTNQTQTVHLQIDFSAGEEGRTQLLNTTINVTANSYHSLGKISNKDGNYEIRVQLDNGTQKLGMTRFTSRAGGPGADGFTVRLRSNEVEIGFYVA